MQEPATPRGRYGDPDVAAVHGDPAETLGLRTGDDGHGRDGRNSTAGHR
ncbi:hypothetical protein [Streptomyces drozdowiczii]